MLSTVQVAISRLDQNGVSLAPDPAGSISICTVTTVSSSSVPSNSRGSSAPISIPNGAATATEQSSAAARPPYRRSAPSIIGSRKNGTEMTRPTVHRPSIRPR